MSLTELMGGPARVHSFAGLQARLNDNSSRARQEHLKWQHIAGRTEEGRRIAGGWTRDVMEAEFARYQALIEEYCATMRLLDEFEEAYRAAAAGHEEELVWATLTRAYGAEGDGSVLVPLASGGAMLVRPDDALMLPPWMQPGDDETGGTT